MYCLGEVRVLDSLCSSFTHVFALQMMVWDPSAGGFIEFASRYMDPAMGFAMGWQFWFQTVSVDGVFFVLPEADNRPYRSGYVCACGNCGCSEYLRSDSHLIGVADS